jgi:hypothetical protein
MPKNRYFCRSNIYLQNFKFQFMKKSVPFKIIIVLLFSGSFLTNQLSSQMPQREGSQVRITGWTDDSHYLIRTLDSEMKPVIESVDIRTGKGRVVAQPKSAREILSGSLPSGVIIGFDDVISPDMNSLIIVKENDLFYFYKGDK